MANFNAYHGAYRFVLLFFNCLLTFGSYFCFDMPSVLQAQFESNNTCNNNTVLEDNSTCCEDCLEMSPDDYNLLYAIYAWTNAVAVIGAGFLIDKLGNQLGLFLFSSLCVVGSSVFALGAHFRGTPSMFPLMLVGRLLFGAGNGSLTIVQNRITAFWFFGKELALAFGITLAFSRLGSVLNFFLTTNIYSKVGLSWTLWGGTMLCGLGFLSAIVVSVLDIMGNRQLGREYLIKLQSKKLRFMDIRNLSSSYWLLAFSIMFFYNGIFPFIADCSKFIQDKYGIDSLHSSYIAGAAYDVSMVFSPFLGAVIDYIGKRGILAVTCSTLTIPVFGLLAFSTVHPLVSMIWLGATYSIAAACLWPSIPLVVSQAAIGTAMGLTTSIQMIGVGISNLIVGLILGKNESISTTEELVRWKYVMIYLLANTIACVCTTISLNFVDKKKGGILNISQHQLHSLLVEQDENVQVNSDQPYEQSDAAVVVNDNQRLLENSGVHQRFTA